MDMPEVAGVTHRTVTARGLRFHVAEAGDGVPLVLLHGFPQHWYAWRRLVPLLPGRRLIMPDLRGCGWTDAPRTGYDIDTLAGDVVALVHALGLDRVQLAGHDWGAMIGFRIRATRPDLLTGLVAVNALPPHPARGPLVRHAWRQWHTALIEYPVIGAWMLRRPGTVPFLLRRGAPTLWTQDELLAYAAPFTERARARAGQQLHWQFVLRDIPRLLRRDQELSPVPASLLFATRDPQFALAQVAGAHDLTIRLVDGAGHYLPEERPDLVAAAISEARTTGSAAQPAGSSAQPAGEPVDGPAVG